MATTKHKAATAVTLAPLAEKSAFEQLVGKYWKHAAIGAVAVVAGVLYWHRSAQQDAAELRAGWDELIQRAGIEGFTRTPSATPDELGDAATKLDKSALAPWARLLQAHTQLAKRDFAGARAALDQIHGPPAGSPDAQAHPLSIDNAVKRMREAIEREEQWNRDHAGLFANPAPPADAPRLLLKTSAGPITVALYPEKAPQHAANFIAAAADGYYNGTKFHRVVAGRSIEGGDPNTRTDDTTTWGHGGADKQLPSEASGLFHFEGALSALQGATPGNSSGSLFSLTVAPVHEWDGQRVVFGAVTEGLDVVRQIANSPLATNATDLPAQPVVLESIEKL